MPYGQQYTYQPQSDEAAPYEYVYEPSYGWSWLEAPWVWGWGPSPWFGTFGAGRFGWYRHGWAYNGYGWRGYRGGYHFGAGRAFAGRPGFYVQARTVVPARTASVRASAITPATVAASVRAPASTRR